MDGTPHLLTDVKFSERRRGYDPEEVDNFLERVSSAVAQLQDKLREATARAEEADARVADAQRAQATAEAELSRVASEPTSTASTAASADPEVDAERASRILLMAQKTADATIDDANATAQQAVSEARTKATELIAEAEAEAEKTRSGAQREADELVEQRRAVVVRDVKELEELKTTVQSDIDVLAQHLDEQRARIRRGVEALALVLDDPEGLHLDPPPDVHAVSVDEVLASAEGGADDDDESDGSSEAEADIVIEAAADADDDVELDIVEETSDREMDVVLLNEGIDVSGVDLTGAPEPARSPGGIFGSQSQNAFSRPAEAAPAGNSRAGAAPGADIDLASQELFAAADREDRSGPPTQNFTPFAESDDPLGVPDDEADKAMRAFFEADFETDTPEQKSRFGFRR